MENPSLKIIRLNPADVQLHWTRKLLPRPTPDRVTAISHALASGCQLPPGYLVEPNLLVAGETRRLAHKARQTDMEFYVVPEEQAWKYALGENANRSSYKFKYQLAFSSCKLAARIVSESIKTRGCLAKNPENDRKPNFGLSEGMPGTLDELSEYIGVSAPLLDDAKATYDKLLSWDKNFEPRCWAGGKEKRTALDYWSERIMDQDDPCTPGAARAGLAGAKAGDDDKCNPTPKQLELFLDGFKSAARWGRSYSKFDAAQRKHAVAQIRRTVSEWAEAPELLEVIETEIKKLKSEQKETGR